MTANIDSALVTQFSSMVHVNAQQKKTRMRSRVMTKMVTGEDYAYDGLGDLEAIEILSRHQKTIGQDIEHTRRRIRMREFRATIYLGKKDKLETLIDPQSQYSSAVANALYRKFDAVALSSAFEAVNTGKDFGTSVTFANDGGLTVNATAGFTYPKILEIEENFIDNEVGNDEVEDLYLTVTGEEHTDLMGENELTSGDFTKQFAVEKGRITYAGDLNILRFGANAINPMLAVNGSTRDCIAASDRALCVGISEELDIQVRERPDLNGTIQVQASMFMGSVRTEGKLIQKVQTTVS